MAEEEADSAAKATEDALAANAASKATEATDKAAVANEVAVGKRILVREVRETDNTIVQYGSEKTERGWTRHIVAFRQGEESPFPLPDVLAIPAGATVSW